MRSDTSRVLTSVVALAALLCAATPAAALKVTIEAPENGTVFEVGHTETFRATIEAGPPHWQWH